MAFQVLIVDDNPDDAFLAARSLGQWLMDCEVGIASDANTGLEMLRTAKFDVVLLDWHLPGLSGGDLLEVWKTESHNVVPIFVLTGSYMTHSQRTRATAAGAQGFLSKPLHPSDLPALRLRARSVEG